MLAAQQRPHAEAAPAACTDGSAVAEMMSVIAELWQGQLWAEIEPQESQPHSKISPNNLPGAQTAACVPADPREDGH